MNGGMGKMMKQLQKMQTDMTRMQEELGQRVVSATSGGGAVKVETNGQKELVSVQIDPELMQEENREMLEDLILVAVNESLKKIDEMIAEEMKKLTGGINLPPGLF